MFRLYDYTQFAENVVKENYDTYTDDNAGIVFIP